MQRKTKKLQENQKKLMRLAKAAFEGVIVNDSSRILDANQRLASMFGYRVSELKGINLINLFAPHSRKHIIPIIKACIKRPYEAVCLKKNGSTFAAEISPRIFAYQRQKFSIIFIRDISSRKKIEDKIKHLNAVLRAIRKVNQLIVKEKDREKLIQAACHNLIETFGYGNVWIAITDQTRKFITSAEAGFGRHFQPMLKLLQQGQLPACMKRALSRPVISVIRNPRISCPECPLRHQYNGRGPMVLRLQCKRKIYGILSVSIPLEFLSEKEERSLFKEVAGDISFALYSLELEEAHKQAEIKAQEARVFAESIANTIREPLLVLDKNLRVISANRSFYRTFKVSPAETRGRLIYELAARQWDIPRLKELLENILPQNTSFDSFEVTHDFPRIGRRSMLLNACRIYRKANKTQMILLALEDITELKKKEEAICNYQEKLRLLSLKLAKTEEVQRHKIAAFLHDQIGQKLALAKIELGALLESAADVKMVKNQMKKLHELITETIKDTRKLTFELIPPVLFELGFQRSLQWLTDQYREQHNIQCDFTDHSRSVPLAADLSSVLFQAVKELLLNSLKHAQADRVKVAVRREGNRIQVSVEDDGVGFDISEAQPYSPQKGGFGLFSIRERLRDFDGRLEIQSERGKGTKVVLGASLAVNKEISAEK